MRPSIMKKEIIKMFRKLYVFKLVQRSYYDHYNSSKYHNFIILSELYLYIIEFIVNKIYVIISIGNSWYQVFIQI